MDVKTVITGILLMYLAIWGTVSLFLYSFFPALTFSPLQAFSAFVTLIFILILKELFTFRKEDIQELSIDEETRIILLAVLKTCGGEVKIQDYTMEQCSRDMEDYNIVHTMDENGVHLYKLVKPE